MTRKISAGPATPVAVVSGSCVSSIRQFSIPLGATGSLVTPVDMEYNYTYLWVQCEDADGVPPSATMSAQVDFDGSGNMVNLYERDDPGTLWSKSVPASGSFGFLLLQALGCRRIRFILSDVATAIVNIKVYGIGQISQ